MASWEESVMDAGHRVHTEPAQYGGREILNNDDVQHRYLQAQR